MQELSVLLQSRVSEVLHVDIHPAATIGRGILMDHATGIVIGETAVVGDNVSLLHQVTLGGSGTGKGVRHPHVGEGLWTSLVSFYCKWNSLKYPVHALWCLGRATCCAALLTYCDSMDKSNHMSQMLAVQNAFCAYPIWRLDVAD